MKNLKNIESLIEHNYNLSDSVKNLLDIDQLELSDLDTIFTLAEIIDSFLINNDKKSSLLKGKTIVTLFYESSTRTRVSFEEAGKLLGADVINMSGSGTSIDKGESLLNTCLTLQSAHTDLIIVRHPHAGAPNFMAKHLLKTKIINAGDGWHAHPTQALIDLYTVKQSFNELKGLKLVMVGDILHSRVARSDILGFHKLGVNISLCAPKSLLPTILSDKTGSDESDPYNNVSVEYDLEKALDNADIVMPLRIQQERLGEVSGFPSLREYSSRFQINDRTLKFAKPNAIVMHPGPMNEGVEISSEIAHSDRSQIENQVRYGVAIRMSLLYLMLSGGDSNE
ncbi:MAG: aspartate carbamoyltransferase catalytic subunit [SAR202 cluster bacterium]|nr:aspartate carbamoyltransferase catalytic subunit [SAR202 cluster bacterium]|tara:strand:+ start:125 stop:1141 length:1017 start_codon:yes stop_codon:yes gene_type:complete